MGLKNANLLINCCPQRTRFVKGQVGVAGPQGEAGGAGSQGKPSQIIKGEKQIPEFVYHNC